LEERVVVWVLRYVGEDRRLHHSRRRAHLHPGGKFHTFRFLIKLSLGVTKLYWKLVQNTETSSAHLHALKNK
jgi:hypothetical protein